MLTKNFSVDEVRCHCGCGTRNVSMVLMNKLQQARDEYGSPIKLNCVCRCVRHNAEVGGVPDSAHLASDTIAGEAADCGISNDAERYALMKVLFGYFTRIEDAPGWIHVDVDPTKPQNVLFRDSGRGR
jgi:zinc D-Ala-D-Ala carboxypeptidase